MGLFFRKVFVTSVAVSGALAIRSAGAQRATEPTQRPATAQPDQRPEYEVLAKGIVANRPFQTQFATAPLRLEFRNLIMGRGESEQIPVPTVILMELRQGAITTTIDRDRRERHQGDFWVVEPGRTITMQNPGEAAVVRALYIFTGAR